MGNAAADLLPVLKGYYPDEGAGGDVGESNDDVTRAIQMNTMNRTQARLETFSRITSEIDRALLRTDARREPMSWTLPTKMEPMMIQIRAGTHPNIRPARIGPFTGPATAIAEKCCPRSIPFLADTKSFSSLISTAGVFFPLSRPKTLLDRNLPYVRYARRNRIPDPPTIAMRLLAEAAQTVNIVCLAANARG